jgi:hypothetical protein
MIVPTGVVMASGIAVRHRVGVADELDREVLTDLDHITGATVCSTVRSGDTGFFHLAGEHGQQPGAARRSQEY